jgi:hypothetical protein
MTCHTPGSRSSDRARIDSATSFGQIVWADQRTSVRSVRVRSAPVRFASARVARVRFASARVARVRCAPPRYAPIRVAPPRYGQVRVGQVRAGVVRTGSASARGPRRGRRLCTLLSWAVAGEGLPSPKTTIRIRCADSRPFDASTVRTCTRRAPPSSAMPLSRPAWGTGHGACSMGALSGLGSQRILSQGPLFGP